MSERPLRITFALLDVAPVPWARARRAGRRSFTAPRVATYQRALALAYASVAHGRRFPADARLAVAITVAWQDRRRRDVDNFAKGVLDALQPCAFDDDAQIDRLVVERIPRRRATRAGVVVTIVELDDDDAASAEPWHTIAARGEIP